MTMIEKMARALCAERVRTTSDEWKRYRYDDSWKLFVSDARIALSAMLEPSEAMIKAAEAVDFISPGENDFVGEWRAAIQAALDEA